VFSTATGYYAQADFEFGATATGAFSDADGKESTAMGFHAEVGRHSDYSMALGSNTQVANYTQGSVAIGTDSTGEGAEVEKDNQFMFGTKRHTYTAPGIVSDLSLARQTDGPLEVLTSDQSGNLATDGGQIFSALSELNGGVAIAMALVNPDFVGAEKFGISGNVSYWEENVALGFTAAGVLGRNVFGSGERITVSGGVGFSVEEQSFGRQGSNSSVGGRGGVQLTW
jgi:hypothetical protein